MPTPFKLGLTGGIGSGKSTAAQILTKHGAHLIDADAIARTLTAPQGVALPHIVATFGTDFLTAQGAMDREKMRALAYTDVAARKKLEAILHPLVAQTVAAQTSAAQARGALCLVYDIPLLAESTKWRKQVDHVLVMDCTPEVQIQRVMARNQWPRAEVEKIIAAQTTREQRLACADSVIFNNETNFELLTKNLAHLARSHFGLSFKEELAR